MTRSRFFAVVAALALLGSALSGSAFAGRGKGHGRNDASAAHHGGGHGNGHGHKDKTKLQFRLDSHDWDTGTEVVGHATLWVRDGHEWSPLSGATLTIWVDGAETGHSLTDSEGHTIITWGPATDGGHSIKVVYAGDDTRKRAKRGQGFHVGPSDDPELDELEVVEDDPAQL